jgi:chromosome segregation ATPase
MKTLITVILILACAGLVIALVVTQKHIDQERQDTANRIVTYSNELVEANDQLNDLRQVNLALTNSLNSSRQQILDLSNQMLVISGTLSNSDTQLKSAQDQIASLEAQNQAYEQKAMEMSNTMTALNAKILAAENELAESETNNSFLQGELTNEVQRLAKMTQDFNDLKTVKTQAKKLHDELVVERRMQWIREGTQPNNNVHGAQLLMARAWPTNKLTPPSHYNLSVEVDSSGAVQIVSDTNAAAANTPPH